MVIGLTGGIASGKSTAGRFLSERGAFVLDADRLGHRAYEPGTKTFRDVVAAFGEELVKDDGSLDRRALGGRVFGDPEAMKTLTDIVWPEIRRLATEEIARLAAEHPDAIVVLEAAVLLEAGWDDVVDSVWVVVVEPEVAVSRLAARNGLDREQALRRIRSQMTNEERIAKADVVLENSGSLELFLGELERRWSAAQNPV